MDFTKLHLGKKVTENVDPLEVAQGTRDNAVAGGEKQHNPALKQKQKQQAARKETPSQSGTVYASEEHFHQLQRQKEIHRMRETLSHDWRKEMREGMEDNDQSPHPYVDVMPPTVHREKKIALQMAKAAKEKKDNTTEKKQEEEVNLDGILDTLLEENPLLQMKRKDVGEKKNKVVDKRNPVVGTNYNKPTSPRIDKVIGE